VWLSVPIKGFEHYVVSDKGEIANMRTMKKLSEWKNSQGYVKVDLSSKGKRKTMYVHRIVALAFHGFKGEQYEVDHINGVRDRNYKENLQWVTRQQNMAYVHGEEREVDFKEEDEGFPEPKDNNDDLPF
jgi:hypothetical protein